MTGITPSVRCLDYSPISRHLLLCLGSLEYPIWLSSGLSPDCRGIFLVVCLASVISPPRTCRRPAKRDGRRRGTHSAAAHAIGWGTNRSVWQCYCIQRSPGTSLMLRMNFVKLDIVTCVAVM